MKLSFSLKLEDVYTKMIMENTRSIINYLRYLKSNSEFREKLGIISGLFYILLMCIFIPILMYLDSLYSTSLSLASLAECQEEREEECAQQDPVGRLHVDHDRAAVYADREAHRDAQPLLTPKPEPRGNQKTVSQSTSIPASAAGAVLPLASILVGRANPPSSVSRR